MTAQERIRKILILEEMKKNKEKAKELGLVDKSRFVKKWILVGTIFWNDRLLDKMALFWISFGL